MTDAEDTFKKERSAAQLEALSNATWPWHGGSPARTSAHAFPRVRVHARGLRVFVSVSVSVSGSVSGFVSVCVC